MYRDYFDLDSIAAMTSAMEVAMKSRWRAGGAPIYTSELVDFVSHIIVTTGSPVLTMAVAVVSMCDVLTPTPPPRLPARRKVCPVGALRVFALLSVLRVHSFAGARVSLAFVTA